MAVRGQERKSTRERERERERESKTTVPARRFFLSKGFESVLPMPGTKKKPHEWSTLNVDQTSHDFK